MRFERSAGILLHPSSLPGNFGIGDLGYEAYNFVNFLESAGQKLWQIFPLGPTGYGDSPYQCFSAFAGNPNLISPEKLRDIGLLYDADLHHSYNFNPSHIDYGLIINYKKELLRKAFSNYKHDHKSLKEEFNQFCESNIDWLDDYSLFMAAKEHFGGGLWTGWDKDLVIRKPEAIKKYKEELADDIFYHKFVQFIFLKQWLELKSYANSKDIKIIGDMPIFIAYDSADLWSHKDLFSVDKEGNLKTVAGVPPDYFSATGQLWGNPLYRWDVMEKDDFLWWRQRLSNLLRLVDIIRIDHFRGFQAYWEVPGDAETAEKGKWRKAPGEKFFSTVKQYLGQLPILAEDLGLITKPVIELRDKFNFPGMNILQFAFGTGLETKFLPHNLSHNAVVYTGSHDNDTTRAYFEKAKYEENDIYEHVQKYLDYYGDDIVFQLVKTAYKSVCDIVIIPMQDMLNLGGDARMNFPGRLGGNWTWRFNWDQVHADIAGTYKYLAELYERPPKPKEELEDVTYN